MLGSITDTRKIKLYKLQIAHTRTRTLLIYSQKYSNKIVLLQHTFNNIRKKEALSQDSRKQWPTTT